MRTQAKLDLFERMVLGEVQGQVKEERERIEADMAERLDKKRKEIAARVDQEIKNEELLLQRDLQKKITRAKKEAKAQVMQARDQVIEEVMERLFSSLPVFQKTQAYETFLEKRLEGILPTVSTWEDVTFTFSKADEERADWIRDHLSSEIFRPTCFFKEVPFTGGFVVTGGDRMTLELTLDGWIWEKKEEVARSVIERIEEGGRA